MRTIVKPSTETDELAIRADVRNTLGRDMVTVDYMREMFEVLASKHPQSETVLQTVWRAVLALNEQQNAMIAMIQGAREALRVAVEERDEVVKDRGRAILQAWDAGEEFGRNDFIHNAAESLAEIVDRDFEGVYKALDIILSFSGVNEKAAGMMDELFGYVAHEMAHDMNPDTEGEDE